MNGAREAIEKRFCHTPNISKHIKAWDGVADARVQLYGRVESRILREAYFSWAEVKHAHCNDTQAR